MEVSGVWLCRPRKPRRGRHLCTLRLSVPLSRQSPRGPSTQAQKVRDGNPRVCARTRPSGAPGCFWCPWSVCQPGAALPPFPGSQGLSAGAPGWGGRRNPGSGGPKKAISPLPEGGQHGARRTGGCPALFRTQPSSRDHRLAGPLRRGGCTTPRPPAVPWAPSARDQANPALSLKSLRVLCVVRLLSEGPAGAEDQGQGRSGLASAAVGSSRTRSGTRSHCQ